MLNFGIPDLAGATIAGADPSAIERLVHQAICDFEPRILSGSLRVHVITDPDRMARRAMIFEMQGKIWSQPMPMRLFWNTEIDLETGNVVVKEGKQ